MDLKVIIAMFLWSLSLRDVSLSTPGDKLTGPFDIIFLSWPNLNLKQSSKSHYNCGVIKVFNKSVLVSAVRKGKARSILPSFVRSLAAVILM